MVLADTYPLLNIFWTMLMFVGFVIFIWLLIAVFVDIFRSHDMGGFAKAIWVIFVIVLPLLGILIYLIARGSKMHEHAVQQAEAQQQAFDAAVRDAAGSGGTADELAKLAQLHQDGTLSDAEYEAQKAKLLA